MLELGATPAGIVSAGDRLLRAHLLCGHCGGWVTWRGRGWRCGVCRHEWALVDEIEAAELLCSVFGTSNEAEKPEPQAA